MGIHEAKQRRWALGIPLLAHEELLEQSGPQPAVGGGGGKGYQTGIQSKTNGWANPPWCSHGFIPYLVSVQSSTLLFACFYTGLPCIFVFLKKKNGCILSALCHLSDFSFNVG